LEESPIAEHFALYLRGCMGEVFISQLVVYIVLSAC